MAVAIAQHFRVLNGGDSDGGVLRGVPAADVKRFPGAAFFVFADTDAEFGERAHTASVENARTLLEDVDENKTESPANGHVGPVAGAK
ncbi:MAG: hypothetical protein ETSY2_29270 [Candidatus Entotheonella gemina]|uniref:Uncharacterized protein n=1 Tax=Candidatus Entotheonella gemina TaxID=1429439 RepID=W4M2C7_9BACT|nr:MAG: hypothetical protein ETSY2_29270 [Candidatus Entotheonella gemina]